MSESPIGSLIVEAEKHSAKKASKAHTATAPCACQVTVSRFSAHGSTIKIERCSEHPVRR